MLCIFQGKERIKDSSGNIVSEGKDAGKIQRQIESQIGLCEHVASIQNRVDGCFFLDLITETIEQATLRISQEFKEKHLPFDPTTVTLKDCKVTQIGESLRPGLRDVFVSPNLKKDDGTQISIEDFPIGHSFGNGVTANSRVRLKDGSTRFFTWCSFPEGTVLRSVQKDLLCSICED